MQSSTVLRLVDSFKCWITLFFHMSNKILVCALCSQDFTRRYSANRHNQNLHHGRGKIVRMIDYIIGRIAGEYNAANPLAYRSGYSQQASSSSHSDAKAFRFPPTFTAHDSSQGNSSTAFSRTNEYVPNQQPNINAIRPHPIIPTIEIRSKVEEIQKLNQTLCPPELAEIFLKQLSANRGNEQIQDRCLDALRSNNLNVAYFYLLLQYMRILND
jgi:hypothetical protein